MSREIGFRVWDKENEEYMNGYEVLLRYDGSVISRYALVTFDTDMPVNVIIERDTGLKDKNGKEIYEGDIIAEHNGDVIGKIIQAPSGEWRIEWIGIFGGSSSLYGHRELCKVIGNIHENLELLEGEK